MQHGSSNAPSTPVYLRIADELRAAILEGRLADGDRLPGENTLMQTYGVARMTARQALAVLRNEGLAVSRKGSGIFVRLFKPVYRKSPARLSHERWGRGLDIQGTESPSRQRSVDQVKVGPVPAPPHISDAFGIEANELVICRSRRYSIDNKPVQLAVSYIPIEIAQGTPITEVDTGPGGTYARLADLGYEPVAFLERLFARMPTPDDAKRLDLPAGTPILVVTRYARTTEGRIVEVNDITLDASIYVLEYEFTS